VLAGSLAGLFGVVLDIVASFPFYFPPFFSSPAAVCLICLESAAFVVGTAICLLMSISLAVIWSAF